MQTIAPPFQMGLRAIRRGFATLVSTDSHTGYADAADVLKAHRIDFERVQRLYPHALRYPPDRILATIAAFKTFNADYVKIFSRRPQVCSMDPSSWETRLAVLRELDLDVAKVISGCSAALFIPSDTLRAKVEALSQMGLKAAKVVRHCPSVFGFSEDRIRRTLAFLNGVGLDGVRVVNASPVVLSYSVETKLRPILNFVTIEMGRGIDELQRNPVCFSYSLDGRLRPRYAFATLHSRPHLGLGTLFLHSDQRFAHVLGQTLAKESTYFQCQNRLRNPVPRAAAQRRQLRRRPVQLRKEHPERRVLVL